MQVCSGVHRGGGGHWAMAPPLWSETFFSDRVSGRCFLVTNRELLNSAQISCATQCCLDVCVSLLSWFLLPGRQWIIFYMTKVTITVAWDLSYIGLFDCKVLT